MALLSFVRELLEGEHVSDATGDPGGGNNVTAQHFAPPGDDSHPLEGDLVATVPSTGRGTDVAVGYVDPKNEPQAGAGEKRIYSRNSDGEVVAVVWLRSNGDVLIESVEGGVVVKVGADGIVRMGSEGAAAGVARAGDPVRVTIPASTFLIAAQAGVLNPDPVEVDGEITSGSSSVTAED